MDEFVDLLMDHDIDMGVDRSFYDPNLREQYIKKQESDQQRLQALKKKQLQQVSHDTINVNTDVNK